MGYFQKLIDQAFAKVMVQAVTLLKSKYRQEGKIYFDKGKNQIVWTRLIVGETHNGQTKKITQEARIYCQLASHWMVQVVVEGVYPVSRTTQYEIDLFDAKDILEVCGFLYDSKLVAEVYRTFKVWKVK